LVEDIRPRFNGCKIADTIEWRRLKMARDNGGSFFAGFLLGGLIGAGLALLFAPQPGQETVTQLKQKTEQLKERLADLSPDEVRKLISETVKEAVEEGREAAFRTKEEMLGRLEHKEEGEPMVGEAPSEGIELT